MANKVSPRNKLPRLMATPEERDAQQELRQIGENQHNNNDCDRMYLEVSILSAGQSFSELHILL